MELKEALEYAMSALTERNSYMSHNAAGILRANLADLERGMEWEEVSGQIIHNTNIDSLPHKIEVDADAESLVIRPYVGDHFMFYLPANIRLCRRRPSDGVDWKARAEKAEKKIEGLKAGLKSNEESWNNGYDQGYKSAKDEGLAAEAENSRLRAELAALKQHGNVELTMRLEPIVESGAYILTADMVRYLLAIPVIREDIVDTLTKPHNPNILEAHYFGTPVIPAPPTYYIPTLDEWRAHPEWKWVSTDSCGCVKAWRHEPSTMKPWESDTDGWYNGSVIEWVESCPAIENPTLRVPDWASSLQARPEGVDEDVSQETSQVDHLALAKAAMFEINVVSPIEEAKAHATIAIAEELKSIRISVEEYVGRH